MSTPWLLSVSASNFRCFRNTGDLTLKPVNILVGENSSGKSSLLALTRIVSEMLFRDSLPFNRTPFFLGSYNEIAFNIGGKRGRTPSFTLGCRVRAHEMPNFKNRDAKPLEARLEIELVNQNSQPKISSISFEFADNERLRFEIYGGRTEITLFSHNKERSASLKLPVEVEGSRSNVVMDIFYLSRLSVMSQMPEEFREQFLDLIQKVETVMFTASGERAYAANPIRNQPQRTYDPVSSTPLSDSNHALQNLASMKRTKQSQWNELKDVIERAGKISRLFNGFDIRLLGKNESDPFQASVKIGGKSQNIVDVGFGVSQMIPIVYDLNVIRSALILVQQPETHLHPAAQAGLGEVIAMLPSLRKGRIFMIETHSDFLIDAIRIAVREGRVEASDFSIWFTERMKGESVVHQLGLDNTGQITNQPDSYREFFLNHQSRLFGF